MANVLCATSTWWANMLAAQLMKPATGAGWPAEFGESTEVANSLRVHERLELQSAVEQPQDAEQDLHLPAAHSSWPYRCSMRNVDRLVRSKNPLREQASGPAVCCGEADACTPSPRWVGSEREGNPTTYYDNVSC